MGEIVVAHKQLPGELEDLARFVLIGRERLTAVRASIRAIERVGLAKEVHAQKLLEAQELAEAVLDAEVKIGELTAQIEKSKGGRPAETRDNGVTSSKESKLEELGINRKQSSRYEKIAKHPKAVESAKRIAREEGRVVSRQDVFDLIVEPTVRKASPEAEARQIDRDHMGYLLEKRLNPVVDIASAQRDKANAEAIAHNNYTRILKTLKEINKMCFFMDDSDIDRMAEYIGPDTTDALIGSLKHCLDYLLTIYNRLVGGVKK